MRGEKEKLSDKAYEWEQRYDFSAIWRRLCWIICTFASHNNKKYRMLKLIADSGSTKTDWILLNEGHMLHRFQTSGLNPSLMEDEVIVALLRREVCTVLGELLSEATKGTTTDKGVDEIEFYGAGCRPEQEERMAKLLSETLQSKQTKVASDLLGAARILCGTAEGIVCILGTGSGSALFDGQRFVKQTPSLGYILGDEGSGTSLGKHLLADVLKGMLPEHLCAAFMHTYQLDVPSIIQKVYREPAPNRYLAQFSRFLSEHREEPTIRAFLLNEFGLFFSRNILNYERPDLPIHFVGSIAAVFQEELAEAAQRYELQLGQVVQSPIEKLVQACT